MTVTMDYIQQWKRGVTGVASSGQHCVVFQHTRLVQEALECESLKSHGLARVLKGKKVKSMEMSSNEKL